MFLGILSIIWILWFIDMVVVGGWSIGVYMALRMIDRSIWVPVPFLWAAGMIDRSLKAVRCSLWLMAGGLHLKSNSSPP